MAGTRATVGGVVLTHHEAAGGVEKESKVRWPGEGSSPTGVE
jgi:hypothetical protein